MKNKTIIKTVSVFLISLVFYCICYSDIKAEGKDYNLSLSKGYYYNAQDGTQEVKIIVGIWALTKDGNGINAMGATIDYDKEIFEELTVDSFKGLNGWEDLAYNTENNRFCLLNKIHNTNDVVEITLKVREGIVAEDIQTQVDLNEIELSDGVNDTFLSNVSMDISSINNKFGIKLNANKGNEQEIKVIAELSSLAENVAENVAEDIAEDVTDDTTKDTRGVDVIVATIDYDKDIFEELTADNFKGLNEWGEVSYNPENNKFCLSSKTYNTDPIVEITFKVKEDIKAEMEAECIQTQVAVRYIEASDGENDLFLSDVSMPISIINNSKESIYLAGYNIYENKYLKNLDLSTTVGEMKKHILTSQVAEVYNQSGEKISDNELIGTGMNVKIGDNIEYKAVVTGDVDGNGKITITDLSKIRIHLVKTQQLENEYEMAADINDDEHISIVDLSKLKRKIVGII